MPGKSGRVKIWLGALGALGVAATFASGVEAAEPVRTLDLTSLFDASPPDLAGRRAAYDTLVAAACLQGIANRSGPNLFVHYVTSVVDGSIDTDQLWFDRLSDPAVGAHLLDGRANETLGSLDDAVADYAPLVTGLAVWDENVPATVNAAFVAAGAEDLVAVRWDASPDSLFAKLSATLPVKVWLVNPDGSSKFLDGRGTANVPDTNRQTSQSAKADVYVWVVEKYVKPVPTKLDPTEYGFMLDGRWVTNPNDYNGNPSATNQLQISNRDWLVMKRGVPFDLSPWSDVAATDAPGQPPGTDAAIMRELISGGRAQAGNRPITIRGFFGWQFKYTTLEGLPPGHEPVMGEWTSVKLVSPYAAGLDADAPGVATLANASFFGHVPLDELPEPQPRPTPEDLVGAGFLGGLADNGSFEDGEAGWAVHTQNHVVYADAPTGPPSARTGLRFLECNTNAVGDPATDALYRDGPGSTPGTHVTLRAFVRGPAGSVNGTLEIHALGGTEEVASVPFTAGPSWTEVKTTLDVTGAGHSSTRGMLRLGTAGVNLDVDDVAFYSGDPASAAVVPANYLLWFVGDYDAASWIASFTPTTWDADGRGLVPLAWDFSGHVASRFPPFFRHALATRTPRDFFIGADSGPGYGNPSEMDATGREIWASAGVHDARVLDTSAGWVLNPLDGIDATHLGATTPFDGDGVLLLSPGGVATPSIVDHAPVVALSNLGGPSVAEASASILGGLADGPAQAAFHSYRAVLWKNFDLAAITHDVVDGHPQKAARFVDPFTFFELQRRALGGDNAHRASFRALSFSHTGGGDTPHVVFDVRNDGWETWRSGGDHAYRVGLHVATEPPRSRAVPADPNGYATRISLPADLPPGGEITLETDLPARPLGHYTVQLDVVEEGVTWFESAGDIPAQVSLDIVVPTPGTGGAGGSGGAGASASGSGPSSGAGGAGGNGGDGGDGCGCSVPPAAPLDPRGAALFVLAAGVVVRRLSRACAKG